MQYPASDILARPRVGNCIFSQSFKSAQLIAVPSILHNSCGQNLGGAYLQRLPVPQFDRTLRIWQQPSRENREMKRSDTNGHRRRSEFSGHVRRANRNETIFQSGKGSNGKI